MKYVKKHQRHNKWDNTKHRHMYAVHYNEMHYGMFSGVSHQIEWVCCFSTVAVCLLNMARHTERRLRVNICLCAVCIHIWLPVSAIWIMLCCLWCEICYGNGLWGRDIQSVCACSFGLVSFFLACSCISRAQGFTVHWVTGHSNFPCTFHT